MDTELKFNSFEAETDTRPTITEEVSIVAAIRGYTLAKEQDPGREFALKDFVDAALSGYDELLRRYVTALGERAQLIAVDRMLKLGYSREEIGAAIDLRMAQLNKVFADRIFNT